MTPQGPSSRRLNLPPVLLRFWGWTLALTLLSAIYTETMIHLLHSKSTLGPLVLWNDDRWWDFLVFQDRFAFFRTPAFWGSFDYPYTYPAPMALAFAILYKVPHGLRLYLLLCVAGLVAGAWMLARALAARGGAFVTALLFALTLPATAWPVWLLLGSANTEGLVAMLLTPGVLLVLYRRWVWGAVLIALAGSLKLFPLALLALLLSKRKYGVFAGALLLFAALTTISLVVLGPSIVEAQHHIDQGIAFVRETYALNPRLEALDVNHSLFSPIKFAMLWLFRWVHPGTTPIAAMPLLRRAFTFYMAAAMIGGMMAYFLRIRHMPMINQVLALTVCAVLLPPYSVDYTLIHLFLPCALLCVHAADRWRMGEAAPGLRLCFALFALIFTVGTFFTWHVRFGSQVRMAALAILLWAAMRYPFSSPAWDMAA